MANAEYRRNLKKRIERDEVVPDDKYVGQRISKRGLKVYKQSPSAHTSVQNLKKRIERPSEVPTMKPLYYAVNLKKRIESTNKLYIVLEPGVVRESQKED